MEMETEEHKFDDQESFLVQRNQTYLNQDNQVPPLYHENNASILYPKHQKKSLQNEEIDMDQENEVLLVNDDVHNQIIEQPEEKQQPLYKLNNIDTKELIKTDIKQLILTKISEDINSKALSDMRYEAQEQISALRNRTNNLQNKNQDLDEQVKSDENRLKQLEVILLKTDEMIELLKENIEKLTVRYRELHINDVLERGLQQYDKLQQIKNSFMVDLKKEKQCLKDAESSAFQHNVLLKTELAQKREVLKSLLQEGNDLKNKVISLDEEVGKILAKRQKLEKKVSVIMNQKADIEKEFVEEKSLLSDMFSKKDVQTAKFTELNERKMTTERELYDVVQELDNATANLLCTDDNIAEKKKALTTMENSLKTIKHEFQESLVKLQLEYNGISTQLNELKTQLSTNNSDNTRLLNELNKLNTIYIAKCDEKVALIHKNLEHQNSIHDINLNKLQQQLQNDVARIKLEELKNQYEVSVTLLDSLERTIVKEKENTSNELMETKLMYEAMQREYNTCFLEMNEKRQYLLKNSKFLEEKAENLQHEVTELEQCIKLLSEENKSIKLMVQQKSVLLEECNNKLTLSRKVHENESPLKSRLKSPNKENITKKVKFNEILSFKSPSSSDGSNVQNATLLETSMREWLEENSENIEQEL